MNYQKMDKALRYVVRKEKELTRIFYKELQQERSELIDFLSWYDQKWFFWDLWRVFTNWAQRVAETYKQALKPIIWRWSESNFSKFKDELPESFETEFFSENSFASKYSDTVSALQLSQLKWSITKTTNDEVKKIIQTWIANGKSYNQIAKEIQEVNPVIFNRERAKLIAQTETWRAFWYGDWIPWKELQKQWFQMEKRWVTRWDSRVRPSHSANAWAWWIDYDAIFPATWDIQAPSIKDIRCRCFMDSQISWKN